MELLNIGFAILLVKITFCVLPGVFGIFLMVSSKETKRSMRNKLCNRLFDVSNAIPYYKFARGLYVLGALLLLFSCGTVWVFLFRGLFS